MDARFVLAGVAILGLAVIGGACSDSEPAGASTSSSSSGSASGGSADAAPATIPVEQCKTRCGAKATGCGGPPSACETFCVNGITEEQASCLESKTCNQLVQAFLQGSTFEQLCAPPANASSSSSSSGGDGLPASITITGALPSGYAPKHVLVSGKVVSLFDVAVKPTLEPQPPPGRLPLISDAKERATVDAPSAGGCDVAFSFTLNAGEVSVHMEGTDEGAASDCGTFTDRAARDGTTITLKDVPWPNGTTKSTVTIELKR